MTSVSVIQKNDKVRNKIYRCRKFKLFLLYSGSFILPGSQYSVRLPCSLFSDTVLILLKKFILLDLCFSAPFLNLIFLPFTVYINSSLLKLENGRNSLVQIMLNRLVFFWFWRSLYGCFVILLHSRWTHVSPVSHWILWWFLATGQVLIKH